MTAKDDLQIVTNQSATRDDLRERGESLKSEEEVKSEGVERRMEEEKEAGLRDPVSGLRYGLYNPKTDKKEDELVPQQFLKMLKEAKGEEDKREEEEHQKEELKDELEMEEEEEEGNESAADKLRRQLMGGGGGPLVANNKMKKKGGVVVVEGGRSEAGLMREDLRKRRKGKLKRSREEEETKEMDVGSLMKRELTSKDANMDEIFMQNIMRLGGNFKGSEVGGGSRDGMDEEEEVDMKMFQSIDARLTDKSRLERAQREAVREKKKWEKLTSQKCELCPV